MFKGKKNENIIDREPILVVNLSSERFITLEFVGEIVF